MAQLLWSILIVVAMLGMSADAGLSSSFYSSTCPNLINIVRHIIEGAVASENRMAASILRLHFHDCFVMGCDASVLLQSYERYASPNNNSLRGFEVIDRAKSAVERSCPGVVSCADILALSARESVRAIGGPSWIVAFGRRDSLAAASIETTKEKLPSPNSTPALLISKFQNQGLSARDMVALSGAHTIGQVHCRNFRARLYNGGIPGDSIDVSFRSRLQAQCPQNIGETNLVNLDYVSPITFDNSYFRNLLRMQGLLFSDQQLKSGGQSELANMVNEFASDQQAFFTAFANGMVRMGNISPLTGSNGEIRAICRSVN